MSAVKGLFRRGIWHEGAVRIVATLALLAVWYGMTLVYEPLNHGPSRIFLRSGLDEQLPFVPVFVVPYVSLNVCVAITMLFLLAFRVRLFRSAAVAMIVTWAISYLVYIVAQSYVERPVVVGDDLFSRMIRTVYAGDEPFNAFPSLHTSLSTIAAIHWWRVDKRIGIPVAIWTVLIVSATVLIRQHYLADVAGGLVLAFATSAVTLRVLGREAS